MNEKKLGKPISHCFFIMYCSPSSLLHKPTNKTDDLQYRNMENLESMGSSYLSSIWGSFLVTAKLTLKLTDTRHSSNQRVQNIAVLTHFCTGKPTH